MQGVGCSLDLKQALNIYKITGWLWGPQAGPHGLLGQLDATDIHILQSAVVWDRGAVSATTGQLKTRH